MHVIEHYIFVIDQSNVLGSNICSCNYKSICKYIFFFPEMFGRVRESPTFPLSTRISLMNSIMP